MKRFNQDEYFMRLALELAKKGEGSVEPNPMVGCVIVRPDLKSVYRPSTKNREKPSGGLFLSCPPSPPEGTILPRIVGTGYHQKFGGDHAEVMALKDAKKRAKGSTVYVTLEPCCHFGKTPPCCDALIQAGVKKVVIAMRDPFPQVAGGGIKALKKAGIEVVTGVLKKDAENLNAPYLTRLSKHRPWIIGKWAMTLDGKMATRTGSSYWISSEASRRRVHEIRSRMDAIMIGSRTAMEDDPRLTVRLPAGETPKRTPIRIVFDSGGTLSAFSELALTAKDVPLLLVFGPETSKEKKIFWENKGAEVLVLTAPTHEQRLILLMEELTRRGVTNLLVEGGGELLGHLFDLEYLDEVKVFISPKIVGGKEAVVPVGGIGQERMKWAKRLIRQQIETIDGEDVLISGRLNYDR